MSINKKIAKRGIEPELSRPKQKPYQPLRYAVFNVEVWVGTLNYLLT